MAAAELNITNLEILHLMHLISDISEVLSLELVCITCHYEKVNQAIIEVNNFIEILCDRYEIIYFDDEDKYTISSMFLTVVHLLQLI